MPHVESTAPATQNREATYTTADFCKEFKITSRTVRYYGDQGLLSPRRAGLARIFNYRDHARLRLILRMKRFGLSLAEIKELLDLYKLENGELAQASVASAKLRERLTVLRRERVELDETIVELESTCAYINKTLGVPDQPVTSERVRGEPVPIGMLE